VLHHAAIYAALAALPLAGTIAAAATPDAGIAPYVGGGAGVIAVGGLMEVTRRLLNGRLIPRETRDQEAETAAYIVAAGQREDRAMKVVEDANRLVTQTAADLKKHNADLAADLVDHNERMRLQTAEQMAAVVRAVEDLRDEIRRDRRER
jgi:hypothetical protein